MREAAALVAALLAREEDRHAAIVTDLRAAVACLDDVEPELELVSYADLARLWKTTKAAAAKKVNRLAATRSVRRVVLKGLVHVFAADLPDIRAGRVLIGQPARATCPLDQPPSRRMIATMSPYSPVPPIDFCAVPDETARRVDAALAGHLAIGGEIVDVAGAVERGFVTASTAAMIETVGRAAKALSTRNQVAPDVDRPFDGPLRSDQLAAAFLSLP